MAAPQKNIETRKARQGRWGVHALIILVCGLILAGIAWFGVEMYGEHLATEPTAGIAAKAR
jgi:hypothetical protein